MSSVRIDTVMTRPTRSRRAVAEDLGYSHMVLLSEVEQAKLDKNILDVEPVALNWEGNHLLLVVDYETQDYHDDRDQLRFAREILLPLLPRPACWRSRSHWCQHHAVFVVGGGGDQPFRLLQLTRICTASNPLYYPR